MSFDDEHKGNPEAAEPLMDCMPAWEPLSSIQRAEDDKEQYTYFYNRIYPWLKEGRLDFHQLAEKTGYKERRIRETLLFRLSSGEVMQLFGKKDGFCYICGGRVVTSGGKEPACLLCLSAIDKAIGDSPDVSLEESPAVSAEEEVLPAPPAMAVADAMDPEPVPLWRETREELPEPLPEMVPWHLYEAVVQELQLYRERYGPLDSGDTAIELPVRAMESSKPGETPSELSQDQAFLEILEMNDQELALMDIPALPHPVDSHEPLRHFGFQRIKMKN